MGASIARYIEWTVVTKSKYQDHHGQRESYLSEHWYGADRDDNDESNRLVDRKSPFHQSDGDWFVRRKVPTDEVIGLFFGGDPVLALIYMKTPLCVTILLTIFIICVAISAIPWAIMGQIKSYEDECNVDTTTYDKAYIFSLEIIMTIGFGAKDIFFGGCNLPLVYLTIHSCLSLILQACILGVIYQRISRTRSRRKTVVMSNNAVIRRIQGKLYFMFQCCELRRLQLISATVRLYCIRYDRIPCEEGVVVGESSANEVSVRSDTLPHSPGERMVTQCQSFVMRLNHPNDDLGSRILLNVPQVIVHAIDTFSPLLPPPEWIYDKPRSTTSIPFYDNSRAPASERRLSDFSPPDAGLDMSSSFDGHITPLPECLASPLHTSSQKPQSQIPFHSAVDTPTETCTIPRSTYNFPDIIGRVNSLHSIQSDHSTLSATDDTNASRPLSVQHWHEKDAISAFMREKNLEIVVVIEGADPQTSHNVQATHSYKCDDIMWDHFFVPCTTLDEKGWTEIDFTKFHSVIPVPQDVDKVHNACSNN